MEVCELLKKAKVAAPRKWKSAVERWAKWQPVYFELIDPDREKGPMGKKEAADWISKEIRLSQEDAKLLYLASKSWKNPAE